MENSFSLYRLFFCICETECSLRSLVDLKILSYIIQFFMKLSYVINVSVQVFQEACTKVEWDLQDTWLGGIHPWDEKERRLEGTRGAMMLVWPVCERGVVDCSAVLVKSWQGRWRALESTFPVTGISCLLGSVCLSIPDVLYYWLGALIWKQCWLSELSNWGP